MKKLLKALLHRLKDFVKPTVIASTGPNEVSLIEVKPHKRYILFLGTRTLHPTQIEGIEKRLNEKYPDSKFLVIPLY